MYSSLRQIDFKSVHLLIHYQKIIFCKWVVFRGRYENGWFCLLLSLYCKSVVTTGNYDLYRVYIEWLCMHFCVDQSTQNWWKVERNRGVLVGFRNVSSIHEFRCLHTHHRQVPLSSLAGPPLCQYHRQISPTLKNCSLYLSATCIADRIQKAFFEFRDQWL